MAASLDNAIIPVCRNYSWASPQYIEGMFVDAKDIHGIAFWYNEVERQQKAYEALRTKK